MNKQWPAHCKKGKPPVMTAEKIKLLIIDTQMDFIEIKGCVVRRWSADKVIIQMLPDRQIRATTSESGKEAAFSDAWIYGTHLVPVKELPMWIGLHESLDNEIAAILSGTK